MSTPHNSAEMGDIAKVVLMPGDPLRAKFTAETFLTDVTCFNQVRNCLGFTGSYKGKKISVMASGMGIPSIGIYSHELYHFYGVESIIRIGTAGGLAPDLNLKDIVLGMGACTNSNYINQFGLPGQFAPICDFDLLRLAYETCQEKKVPVKVGNLVSNDTFYDHLGNVNERWRDMGALAVEMESAGLYANAASCGKRALTICSISDHLFKPEQLSPKEREQGLTTMLQIALDTGIKAQDL